MIPIHPTAALPLAAIGDISTSRWWAIVLGCLFALVALTLLIASWTRWGQTKSLTKCIALAFLAHVWLLMYAYGTRIITPGAGGGFGGGAYRPGVVQMTIEANAASTPPPPSSELQSVDETASSSDELPTQSPIDASDQEPEIRPWEAPLATAESDLSPYSVADLPLPEIPTPEPVPASSIENPTLVAALPLVEPDTAALAEFLSEQAAAPALNEPPDEGGILPPSRLPNQVSPTLSSVPPAGLAVAPRAHATSSPPSSASQSSYQNRFAPNRMDIVRAGGGDENTEAAVQNALEWLARSQGPDGGWNAAEYGGGNPIMIGRAGPDGEIRQNAGVRANTAMTGLAILAFLGAGHHHLDGPYAPTVHAGLRYLLGQQLPSGDMSGRDQVGREDAVRFARMYSHGMASLAVAEAYAITQDPQLLPATRLACQYSIRAMNPRSGGWRYEYPTEDPGDTSQFGWQAMLLHSATQANAYDIGADTRSKMLRFLDSVSVGQDGGLATYRPRMGNFSNAEQATPSMTAEAMASRLLLGYPIRPGAAHEAQRLLLANPPGRGQDNFYYWYYATLAMYQSRSTSTNQMDAAIFESAWKSWNDALKFRLCTTQIADGPAKGSWNPSCVWGAYGGRVYTTALGCLSLEVYYRYLPIYRSQIASQPWNPDTTLRK
ncbi:hypothetical protein VN12_21400 [Pirellula sp. SH-Sr6A]|uniref:prenyltransferase/squalene oxidase repeat-containing protein n=1 Tax=Pirellula sp. SH-Sr6A TaxID=1632865 RepID=UPI00078D96E9|nr:prenyltransferase/squalene oxidase repeat-containing protein [Pirellula sp. SH-Sr6A]AMV34696.1 hypothetical protein VN12_21400 [Pirellula sp. SH-Sr6A]